MHLQFVSCDMILTSLMQASCCRGFRRARLTCLMTYTAWSALRLTRYTSPNEPRPIFPRNVKSLSFDRLVLDMAAQLALSAALSPVFAAASSSQHPKLSAAMVGYEMKKR